MIGRPPVGGIAGESVLDKGHLRPARLVHRLTLLQRVIRLDRKDLVAGQGHGLKNHLPATALADDIESQQRVAQVVENAHEPHQVVHFRFPCQLINREQPEFDAVIDADDFRGPAGLFQIAFVSVYGCHLRTPSRQFEAVVARIAADVQRPDAGQVLRQEG
ncbi:MAG: hypothetical protein ACD_75C01712G0001 [uncultured bacterium]|nr:MAG: hypothetical protein ACD_75C01712G0001 [uncultured bacterium]